MLGCGYFPPSLDFIHVERYFEKASELSARFSTPCIMTGDFNARLGEVTGDTKRNGRCNNFLELLERFDLSIAKPQEGKWTTYAGGGRGITDHVIHNQCNISNLKVHEKEAPVIGSDHRLITFDIDWEPSLCDVNFTRWNIRKLKTDSTRKDYALYLAQTIPNLICCDEITDQENIDRMWVDITKWIEDAISETCGTFKYKSRDTKLMNKTLTELQSELKEKETQYVMSLNMQGNHHRATANSEYLKAKKKLDIAILNRRTELFEDMVSNLANPQNAGPFMKMVKSMGKRARRKKSLLTIDDLQKHEAYFVNTFGGNPEGRTPVIDNLAQDTADTPNTIFFSKDLIEEQMKRLKAGKASGSDGIFSELLMFGGETMINALTSFFHYINVLRKIPNKWKEALILPIFKKGDPSNIANYRPIALTQATRRLYERILLQFLKPYYHHLSPMQAGFIPKRSTIDQIFTLDEIHKQNPKLYSAMLDLKSAYDLVNRNLLWEYLIKIGVQADIISALRMLFEENYSILLIEGNRSNPIDNRRGLLQGSSLSPILFNFYINTLIIRLEALSGKLNTREYFTNSLFFADDANIHAQTAETMSRILLECENWSLEYGMKFSPEKCFILGEGKFLLYNQALTNVDTTTYLGIEFDRHGINWTKTVKIRAEKATQAIFELNRYGFNLTGWPPMASRNVYLMFIRPILEYGLQAMMIEDQKAMETLQKAQNRALKTMLSVPGTASNNAIHKLLQLPSMKLRKTILNEKYKWKRSMNEEDTPCNFLWESSDYRLAFDHELTKKDAESLTRDEITLLDSEMDNVAGTIEINSNTKKILEVKNKLARVTLVHWRCGMVARHQKCKRCGEDLSRKHAVSCSGALRKLRRKYTYNERDGEKRTIIDYLLNTRSDDHDTIKDLYSAIKLIYKVCLKMRQKTNGFFYGDVTLGIG